MLDLTKKIYKKLDDGIYQVQIVDWSIKATKPTKDSASEVPVEYVSLECLLPELQNRPLTINLFEVGLNIFGANLINMYKLEEQPILDLLNWAKGKVILGYQETKVDEDKTYYNWFLAKEPEAL